MKSSAIHQIPSEIAMWSVLRGRAVSWGGAESREQGRCEEDAAVAGEKETVEAFGVAEAEAEWTKKHCFHVHGLWEPMNSWRLQGSHPEVDRREQDGREPEVKVSDQRAAAVQPLCRSHELVGGNSGYGEPKCWTAPRGRRAEKRRAE